MVLSKSKYKRLESCGLSDFKILSLEIEGVLMDVAHKNGDNILDDICTSTLKRVQERLMELDGRKILKTANSEAMANQIIELHGENYACKLIASLENAL